MHRMTGTELIDSFYSAFQARDHQAMARCYHPEVIFSDPVFTNLKGWKASAMWRMLCERGKDLELQYRDVEADDDKGSAFWEAHYTFSQTGKKVHNKIQAKFRLKDGLIVEHRDTFDLKAWMGMALGWQGKILGQFGFGRAAVQKKAATGLDIYIQKQNLGPDDFNQ